MAKQKRKAISKALKKGIDSGFKIDETADDSGFGTPKTKQKSLNQTALDQLNFNDTWRSPGTVGDKVYDRSPGEVPQEYDGDINSFSDYRIVDNWKKADKAAELESGYRKNAIHDAINYTGRDARSMDPVYNWASGYEVSKMGRRKDVPNSVYAIKDQPTLNNPNAKGLDEKPTTAKNQTYPEKELSNQDQEAVKRESLITAIQPNPIAETTKNQILENTIKDSSTPSELEQASKVSEEAGKEAEKIENNINEATVTTAPYGAFDAEDAESIISGQANNTNPVITGDVQQLSTTTEAPQQTSIAGDGSAVTNVVKSAPMTPSYQSTTTTQDVQNGMANMYAKLNAGVPKAVVEKLSIQDYYPNAGRNIAVGSFSGSRIGSQTIYSGAGALLPMGLYDARKRALVDAAKEKKKQLDKFFDVIDTAPQYSKAVNESYNNWLNESLASHGYDADRFLSDPNIRKEYAKRLTNAKDISYWAKWADDYIKNSEGKENYGTAEGINIAGQIKMAIIDHMDEIASGEKSLKDFIDIDKARLYQNIIPQMDIVVKETLSNANLGKMPINMRTGIAGMDPEDFAQERDEFVMKLKSKTLGKDEYLSGFKKFFTGDYEQIVDGLIASGKFSEEQRDAALDYFAGQMQEQIELKPEFVANDSLEYARLAQQNRQWQAEFDYKKEQGKTPWTVQNEIMNKPNSSGKTMAQELAFARKKGYKGDKLKAYMLRKAREMGMPNAEWDPHMGTIVMKAPVSQYESQHFWSVSTTNKEANIKLLKKTKTKDGKYKWVPTSVPVSDFVANKNSTSDYLFDDGSKITSSDFSNWQSAWKNGKVAINPSNYESYYGISGSKSGVQRPVSSNTIGDYSTERAVNMKNSVGTLYGYTVAKDSKGNPVPGADGSTQFVPTPLRGTVTVAADISDQTQRRAADSMFGNDASQFKYTQQGGTTESGSGSSSSQ